MVKTSLQALCLSLLSYTIASPLAVTDAEAVEAIVLEKRIPENRCTWRYGGITTSYTIWMAGWGNNDWSSLSGCGTGLLDNLRGQCGDTRDWGCDEIRENPHDTKVHFTLDSNNGVRTYCVEEAIRRASAGGSVRISCVSG
jgi:hypothetical protein